MVDPCCLLHSRQRPMPRAALQMNGDLPQTRSCNDASFGRNPCFLALSPLSCVEETSTFCCEIFMFFPVSTPKIQSSPAVNASLNVLFILLLVPSGHDVPGRLYAAQLLHVDRLVLRHPRDLPELALLHADHKHAEEPAALHLGLGQLRVLDPWLYGKPLLVTTSICLILF